MKTVYVLEDGLGFECGQEFGTLSTGGEMSCGREIPTCQFQGGGVACLDLGLRGCESDEDCRPAMACEGDVCPATEAPCDVCEEGEEDEGGVCSESGKDCSEGEGCDPCPPCADTCDGPETYAAGDFTRGYDFEGYFHHFEQAGFTPAGGVAMTFSFSVIACDDTGIGGSKPEEGDTISARCSIVVINLHSGEAVKVWCTGHTLGTVDPGGFGGVSWGEPAVDGGGHPLAAAGSATFELAYDDATDQTPGAWGPEGCAYKITISVNVAAGGAFCMDGSFTLSAAASSVCVHQDIHIT